MSVAKNVVIGTPARAATDTKLGMVLGGAAGVVFACDFCFWDRKGTPGLAAGVFFAVVAAAILLNRVSGQVRRTGHVILALLVGSLLETAIETGFTNTVVLLALTAALAGDTFFDGVSSLAGRLLSQFVALIRAPGRVLWLGVAILERGLSSDLGGVFRLGGAVILLVPSLVIILVFGALLASGNAVFGTWTHDGFAWIWSLITFDVEPWRIILWLFVGAAALPLLRPVQVAAWWWSWTERLPRWPDLIPHRAAVWNSVLVLVALNGLFAVANVADVLFLWSGQKLPVGVTYSEFVHNGVEDLIWTVLLSAGVLTSIFQQTPVVAQRRALKILGGIWIAQNLFLLLSVGLRLKCYTEAYDLTVERLGVVIFLVLVAAGFGLLAVKIARDRSLSWLMGGGVLAVFATLYVAQFLNLAGWAADYNEARWERDPSRALDVSYLRRLGPAAWPALVRAEKKRAGDSGAVSNRIRFGATEAETESPETRFDGGRWREFSLRAWWNRGALEEEPRSR